MGTITIEAGMERLAGYIFNRIGRQDWERHVEEISGYFAAFLGIPEKVFEGYLMVEIQRRASLP